MHSLFSADKPNDGKNHPGDKKHGAQSGSRKTHQPTTSCKNPYDMSFSYCCTVQKENQFMFAAPAFVPPVKKPNLLPSFGNLSPITKPNVETEVPKATNTASSNTHPHLIGRTNTLNHTSPRRLTTTKRIRDCFRTEPLRPANPNHIYRHNITDRTGTSKPTIGGKRVIPIMNLKTGTTMYKLWYVDT